LKNDVSLLILLVSIIAYIFLFVYSYFMAFIDDNSCTRGFWLLTINASYWWMIPAWIAVLVLDRRYKMKELD